MTAPIFVDTNVLVNAVEIGAGVKFARCYGGESVQGFATGVNRDARTA